MPLTRRQGKPVVPSCSFGTSIRRGPVQQHAYYYTQVQAIFIEVLSGDHVGHYCCQRCCSRRLAVAFLLTPRLYVRTTALLYHLGDGERVVAYVYADGYSSDVLKVCKDCDKLRN